MFDLCAHSVLGRLHLDCGSRRLPALVFAERLANTHNWGARMPPKDPLYNSLRGASGQRLCAAASVQRIGDLGP